MSNISKISMSYSDGVSKITHEHDGDGPWRDHVKAMVNFLRGVGYTVPREFEDEMLEVAFKRLEEINRLMPILAAKDAEIERLKAVMAPLYPEIEDLNALVNEYDSEIERLNDLLSRVRYQLEDSVGDVSDSYTSNWRHGMPTRAGQLQAYKDSLDRHHALIEEIKQLGMEASE